MRAKPMGLRKILTTTAICFLLGGCASTYTIDSTPGNAKVFLDGTLKGETPYTDIEKVWIGTKHNVTIMKEGFETEEYVLEPTVWVGQRILLAIIFPPAWLWTKKYAEKSSIALAKLPEPTPKEGEPLLGEPSLDLEEEDLVQ
ncbi:PEGA domain-containing protein [Bdellovibrionota bacterium]